MKSSSPRTDVVASTLSLLPFLVVFLLAVRYRAHSKVLHFLKYWIGVGNEDELDRSRDRDPPFSVLFRDQADSDWESGVEFDIRCRDSADLYMCWGVETGLISQLKQGSGLFTTSHTSISELFAAHSYSVKGPIHVNRGEAHRLIALPERDFKLGLPPRKHVPLVLLCSVDDYDVSDSDIVTMMTVVHIRDAHCTDITGPIDEVVNLRNGHWVPLNKYYGGSFSVNGTCVVCRDSEVTMLLLPCRHTCTCDDCTADLEGHCPMCGAKVVSTVLI